MPINVRARIHALISWLQRISGTDVAYVARGGFWTSITIGISTITSLLLALTFANLLPKETYGMYKYILSLAGVFSFLTLTGINTAVTHMTATGHQNILSHSIRLQLRHNILYTVAALIGAGYYVAQGNNIIAISILILGIAFPLTTTFNTYYAVLIGQQRFKKAALFSSLTSIFYTAVMIAALWKTHNVIFIVAAYAIGNMLPMIIFHRAALNALGPQHTSQQEEHELSHYSRHLSIVNIFSTASHYIDKIVLFHFFGSVQLAVYTLAQAMPERIRGFSKNINGLLLPRLSQRSMDDIRSVFYIRILQSAALGLLISSFYFVLAPYAFRLLLPQYLESIQYSQVIMFSFVFTLPATYMGSVFRAKKMLRTIYASSISANIVRIVLFIILGKMYGIWGLVVATLGVYAVGMVLNFILWEYNLDADHTDLPRNEDEEALGEETRPPPIE